MNTPKSKAIVSEYKKYMKIDNIVTYVTDKNGKKISRKFVESLEGYILYDADPNCDHEQDTRNINGVKCIHCNGWYCA